METVESVKVAWLNVAMVIVLLSSKFIQHSPAFLWTPTLLNFVAISCNTVLLFSRTAILKIYMQLLWLYTICVCTHTHTWICNVYHSKEVYMPNILPMVATAGVYACHIWLHAAHLICLRTVVYIHIHAYKHTHTSFPGGFCEQNHWRY